MNILLGIGHLKEEQLRDNGVGDIIVHGCAEENDAVDQEPGIDVVGALATTGLLHDVGDETLHSVIRTH